jgi:predicted nucleic acid-binding protein
LHFLTPDEIYTAWQVFHDFRDKKWSFTDCTSKVVMERLACTQAMAFDEHFRQFGEVLVEPQ